jgi:hypothetical protein
MALATRALDFLRLYSGSTRDLAALLVVGVMVTLVYVGIGALMLRSRSLAAPSSQPVDDAERTNRASSGFILLAIPSTVLSFAFSVALLLNFILFLAILTAVPMTVAMCWIARRVGALEGFPKAGDLAGA